MTISLVDAESVLALDIGSVYTRAMLFDVVDGQYRFLGAGVAPTTAGAPFYDVSEGMHRALEKLQDVTGRSLFNAQGQLILPSQPDGNGIDQMMAVFTAGPELRMVTIGLLETASLESANHLAGLIYGKLVESIGLNDRRRTETQVDAIIKAQPNLIILAGGTERGATRSISKLVEMIALVLEVLPREKRPEIVYAGNQVLAKRIKDLLSKQTTVYVTPNIRPSIDVEDLGPAQETMAKVVYDIRSEQVGGLKTIGSLCTLPILPASHGYGRMIRFMRQLDVESVKDARRVLGVDLGASATTIAATVQGALRMHTFRLGMGYSISEVMRVTHLEEVVRWLPMHVPEDEVRDYLWQRTLYPMMQPMTSETLAIEQAMARQALRAAMQGMEAEWPEMGRQFDPIVVSGAILAQGSTPGQALLQILDGLEPVGISTILLDTYGILPVLGAIAGHNPLLPVHVLESSALVNLGTVIRPVCNARYGTPILKVRLVYDNDDSTTIELRHGSLTVLPVQPNQHVKVYLTPLRSLYIPGVEIRHGLSMIGGMNGIVVDARGHPLSLPSDAPRRRDLLKKWSLALGS